jgi:hypothetical protein
VEPLAGHAQTCSAVSSTGCPSYSSLTLAGSRVYSGGNRTPACSSVVHLISLFSGSLGCRDGSDACTKYYTVISNLRVPAALAQKTLAESDCISPNGIQVL